MLNAEKTSELAHALYRAQGGAAEALAARRQRESAETGNLHEAEDWRSIRAVIRRIRGANES